ncbi:putative ornithine decarboxylase [Rosa chinensis]|uniref:ornithine decarboxylase n=1 Tax=Rosa chinensis TaxID=74649 RepID=A0A2P6RF22_ROSCH|nr:putative ornithine decarboxylase [Rosa chinensis]
MGTWKCNLPMVQPFYAIKCNPHPNLLATLVAQGSSFDCGILSEIESILALGVSPDHIIYANPYKASSHINFPLSSKFGTLPEEVSLLLQAAQTARLRVAGVSFHIGTRFEKTLGANRAVSKGLAPRRCLRFLMVCGKATGCARTYSLTVFGPTCDLADKVLEGDQLPELEVNNLLVFRNMGAYTLARSSHFHGFGSAKITYLSN